MKEKAIAVVRVSTEEQMKRGTSFQTQDEWVAKTVAERDLKLIHVIRESISGEVLPKKYFAQILEIAEKEKPRYILFYSLDRFARNLPYGSLLLEKLREKGVKILTSTAEYDLSDPNDRLQVSIALLLAETEQYYRCERTARGIFKRLRDGGIPYSPPFGCEVVDGKVRIAPDYRAVIEFIFSAFIQTKCYSKTAEMVNEKYGEKMGFKLDGQKVKRIVTNPIYTGFVQWNGLLFGQDGSPDVPNKDLQVVDRETFRKAQDVVRKISKESSRKPNPSDSLVAGFIEEYGADVVLTVLNLKVSCPKCDSTSLKENGNEIVGGVLAKKYICKKCGYQFRFPSAKQLKEIRGLNPRRCMRCGSADKFRIEQTGNLWKLTCKECGHIVFLPIEDEYVNERAKEKKDKRSLVNKQKHIVHNQSQKTLNRFL